MESEAPVASLAEFGQLQQGGARCPSGEYPCATSARSCAWPRKASVIARSAVASALAAPACTTTWSAPGLARGAPRARARQARRALTAASGVQAGAPRRLGLHPVLSPLQ